MAFLSRSYTPGPPSKNACGHFFVSLKRLSGDHRNVPGSCEVGLDQGKINNEGRKVRYTAELRERSHKIQTHLGD